MSENNIEFTSEAEGEELLEELDTFVQDKGIGYPTDSVITVSQELFNKYMDLHDEDRSTEERTREEIRATGKHHFKGIKITYEKESKK